jgi:hypothetical protein
MAQNLLASDYGDQRYKNFFLSVSHDLFENIDNMAQYYKTFYDRNLLAFLNRVFVPGKPFLPSLMFANKAGAYLSNALFKCSTQE